MGKGRIVSGGADGSYTVELLHNRERINAELDFLAAKLTELQTELDALETEREGLVSERNAIAADIDEAVANAEEGEIPDVEALLVELAQVSAQIQAQDVRIALIQGRMLEARKRQQMLQAIPTDPQQQAWCADFTEDLTGEVATVEVPAEGAVGQFVTWRRVQIRPGYEGRASYLPARDGQMFHREGQVGYQAYLNAAILPGVQRWRPQYRIGTITAVDEETDTCSLTIQGEDSSAQSLVIDPPNLQYTKTGVPIEYMDCNAQVFEVGDKVLIEFQGRDWNQPKVIGFESNPRECEDRIARWIFYGLKVPALNHGAYASGGDNAVSDRATWVGTAASWVSTDSVRTRVRGNLMATNEIFTPATEPQDPDNLVEAFTVGDLTEANHRVGEFAGTFPAWITATLSGTQVGTVEGLPVYDAVIFSVKSPAFVRYANVINRFGLNQPPGAQTDGSDYRESWTQEFHAGDNPTIEGWDSDYKVIGWIAVDQFEEITNETDWTMWDTTGLLLRAVLEKIEPV